MAETEDLHTETCKSRLKARQLRTGSLNNATARGPPLRPARRPGGPAMRSAEEAARDASICGGTVKVTQPYGVHAGTWAPCHAPHLGRAHTAHLYPQPRRPIRGCAP